jgi:hypothetical protein
MRREGGGGADRDDRRAWGMSGTSAWMPSSGPVLLTRNIRSQPGSSTGDPLEVLAQPRQRRLAPPPVVLPGLQRAAGREFPARGRRQLIERPDDARMVVELRVGTVLAAAFGPHLRRRAKQHAVRGRGPENGFRHRIAFR